MRAFLHLFTYASTQILGAQLITGAWILCEQLSIGDGGALWFDGALKEHYEDSGFAG